MDDRHGCGGSGSDGGRGRDETKESIAWRGLLVLGCGPLHHLETGHAYSGYGVGGTRVGTHCTPSICCYLLGPIVDLAVYNRVGLRSAHSDKGALRQTEHHQRPNYPCYLSHTSPTPPGNTLLRRQGVLDVSHTAEANLRGIAIQGLVVEEGEIAALARLCQGLT